MHRKLFRPTGCGIPIGLMLAALAGQAHSAACLAAAFLLTTILSLAAAENLRRSASRLSSHQQVLGLGIEALFLTLVGGAVTAALGWYFIEQTFEMICWSAAGAALAGTRCLEELAHAEGDGTSGSLADFLGGLAAVVPMLIFDQQAKATMIGAGVAFGVALVIIMLMRRERPEPARAGLKATLGAVVREAMYPVMAGVMSVLLVCMMPERGETAQTAGSMTVIDFKLLLPGFFAGLAIVAAARTTYRRDEGESGVFHIVMASTGLLLALGAAAPFVMSAMGAPLMRETAMIVSGNLRLVLAGLAVGLIQYAAFKPRYVVSIVMFFAIWCAPVLWAFVYRDSLVVLVTVVPAVIAWVLTVPDWMDVHRRRRAMRIRRRAMKR